MAKYRSNNKKDRYQTYIYWAAKKIRWRTAQRGGTTARRGGAAARRAGEVAQWGGGCHDSATRWSYDMVRRRWRWGQQTTALFGDEKISEAEKWKMRVVGERREEQKSGQIVSDRIRGLKLFEYKIRTVYQLGWKGCTYLKTTSNGRMPGGSICSAGQNFRIKLNQLSIAHALTHVAVRSFTSGYVPLLFTSNTNEQNLKYSAHTYVHTEWHSHDLLAGSVISWWWITYRCHKQHIKKKKLYLYVTPPFSKKFFWAQTSLQQIGTATKPFPSA
jgi:hypothetical protein